MAEVPRAGAAEVDEAVARAKAAFPAWRAVAPADRAVLAALPRRLQPRFPGRADAADEDEAGVAGRRHIDGEFAVADFTFPNHLLIQ